MPKRYHIDIRPIKPRVEQIAPYRSIETTPCLYCAQCTRYAACIFDSEHKNRFSFDKPIPDTFQCANCFRCVQECKGNIVTRVRNPRYDALGNDYWKPQIISSIWNQAETGKIPVSGAGYRGPFCGPGFDQMWTDMSEIVRPTRDGIHNREYISTVIELGRRPDKLVFDDNGALLNHRQDFVEISIPIFFNMPDNMVIGKTVRQAIAGAAGKLGTLSIVPYSDCQGIFKEQPKDHFIVKCDPAQQSFSFVEDAPVLELAYSDNIMEKVREIKEQIQGKIISIKVPLDEHAVSRVSMLTLNGAEIIHLEASPNGNGIGARSGDFVVDLIREVHGNLVGNSIRDRVTLLVSGGIAMAEHVAKIILCGVDGVGIDLALMATLECRLCKECNDEMECPAYLEQMPVDYGEQRIINLIGSWHSQLIEIMGAMGIREIRRLRGETGRAMFFKDLERENFAPIFGDRKTTAVPEEIISGDGDGDQDSIDTAIVYEPIGPVIVPSGENGITYCPSRYRNKLNKYTVIRTGDCISCGKCTEICTHGIHEKAGGRIRTSRVNLCPGIEKCRESGPTCQDVCSKGAIRIEPNPLWNTFGDPRWTADLIVSTWTQAEMGEPPANGLEYRTGASGGGFDRIDFLFPERTAQFHTGPDDVDLSLRLNRRSDDTITPPLEIGIPIYGGGMSFGSTSLTVLLARAKAYTAFNSLVCTGEGGFPDALIPYSNNVITQVATGLFGVREETIQRVRIIEFKYAQGAKPGLGGHLLGDKVTPAVAKMREAVAGSSLFSPFPFHSVYSVEDHKKHIDWIKAISPKAVISVKVSTPTDVDMVAVGSYYAGAHIIHIDGSYGGTGAAPDIAKKNIAMPIEYAIPKVHNFLTQEGVRGEITVIASGGIRSAYDIAKSIALGADGVVIATSEMMALECIRCGRCESGRGCPRGIATTDPELSNAFTVNWATQRLINLLHSYAVQLREILWRFGMKSVRELVGRSDLLTHLDYVQHTTEPVQDLVTERR
jgi:glutamate synthase domain-containing protein 2